MPGPQGFILPQYQASSSSSQFNHPGEQKDVPTGGKLRMGAASDPGAVPGEWKEPNPLFTGASNVVPAEGILPSPTSQNSVLLSKEQVIEYVQDQFGPALQKFGRPIYKKPYNEAADRVEFPKGNAIQDRIDKGDFKFPEVAKKGMAVDEDPFPADFGANMVYVDMREAPRTAPRQKISLGAPSQVAKGKQILHDSDDSPDDHPSPIWWDQEVIRSRRGSSSILKKPSDHYCCECGKPEKPKRLQSMVVKRPREETPSLSPRRLPQKRVSVFNRLQPTTHEVQKQMSALVIIAPQEGRPRMVKPPGSVSPNHWFKVKHPKFPQPEIPLSKSQKRRRQRIRQADRLAQGIPTPPPIPPKRSLAPQYMQKKSRMEYRPVQKLASQHKEPSSVEVPKARKPAWKDILAKPRPINIRSSEDMLVVQEEVPVTKVSSSLANLTCNMVFVFPTTFMAKEGQPSSMDGDVEASGDTPEISSIAPVATIPVLKASTPEASESQIPSIVHLRPLYIQGHLDGIPVNRILVDNGSAANLMSRFMLVKLGKGDQDLLPSSASISDFAGGITTAQEESLRFLDSEDNSVLTIELFFEGDSIPPDDVIQLEDLEAPPAKLDDLKDDVQDPLEEVNLGSEDHPKPIYVSQRLPEVVKNAYIDLLHEYKDCFAWESLPESRFLKVGTREQSLFKEGAYLLSKEEAPLWRFYY
ncbi:hypothetical protein Vadar_025065 [Vaccinium darrowii]|uniref:Uncharacterized protein n=1 Tax=Vaccinium darrowii TaxID=229202 RepID=A0ACB7X470_9ERIC|nr:hypothetical protein Vadar_025065 [Vaccinium darrowii]